MDFFEEILPLAVRVFPLLYLSFPHLSLEQALWEPTVEASPTSLAKLEALAIIAFVPLGYSTLEQRLYYSSSFSLIFLLLSYSPSSFYPRQLSF